VDGFDRVIFKDLFWEFHLRGIDGRVEIATDYLFLMIEAKNKKAFQKKQ